jgi:hypothetical protein
MTDSMMSFDQAALRKRKIEVFVPRILPTVDLRAVVFRAVVLRAVVLRALVDDFAVAVRRALRAVDVLRTLVRVERLPNDERFDVALRDLVTRLPEIVRRRVVERRALVLRVGMSLLQSVEA